MRVQLRQNGGPAHLADLDVEQEVRHGRLFADDELGYPPWTGPGLRRLGDIPELAEAFASPEARFAAHLRAPRFPAATALTVGLVAIFGGLQVAAMVAAAISPELAGRLSGAVLRGAVGYEPFLLDGAWWTPWTSQVLHAGAVHLVMNLPVLAYCGYRVERALGVGGFAVVAASAVLGGTAAITAFGSLPVVGASILAYGLWGAQIAVGLRAGEAIPAGWRGFYGWGNLVLFAPLFVAGLGADGVSDLGHLGGLAGGVLAALFVPAESFRRAEAVEARRRANLRLAAAVAAAPMLAGPALARVAPVLSAPAEPVAVAEAGASIALPWRMADHPTRFGGLPAWVVSRNQEDPLFVGLVRLGAPRTPTEAELAAAWGGALDARLEPAAAPPPLGDGWVTHAWVVRDGDVVTGRLVEHGLRRGSWLLRAGYLLPPDARAGVGREALYRHVLSTLAVEEPPALATARREHALFPNDPERAWSLAHELGEAALFGEADGAWLALVARPDGWRWEGVRGRLALWDALGAADPAALDRAVGPAERAAWLRRALDGAPPDDERLLSAALDRLARDGACDDARALLAGPSAAALGERFAAPLAACGAALSEPAPGPR